MKVVQRYPFDNFAKITVVAGSDRVYWQYKSLVYEADRQFLYSEPGLQIHLVKSAEPGIARASYIALLFFIINFGFRSIWGRGELGGRIWVGLLATFFEGRPENLVAALLDPRDQKLSREEIAKIRKLIDENPS